MAGNGERLAQLLEKTFGPYPGPLMKDVVADHYKDRDSAFVARLYKHIVMNYKPYGGPPCLAEIRVMVAELPPSQLRIEEGERVTNEEGLAFVQKILKMLDKKAGGHYEWER